MLCYVQPSVWLPSEWYLAQVHFDAPRIENWLRITIGTPEQMQIFLNTLDKIMEE